MSNCLRRPPVAAFELSELDGISGFAIAGGAAGDALGTAVGRAGDVNADGPADVVVGAPGADANGTDSGAAYVIFGEDLTTIDLVFRPWSRPPPDRSLGIALHGAASSAASGSAVGRRAI